MNECKDLSLQNDSCKVLSSFVKGLCLASIEGSDETSLTSLGSKSVESETIPHLAELGPLCP